jgi:hypothetical protein
MPYPRKLYSIQSAGATKRTPKRRVWCSARAVAPRFVMSTSRSVSGFNHFVTRVRERANVLAIATGQAHYPSKALCLATIIGSQRTYRRKDCEAVYSCGSVCASLMLRVRWWRCGVSEDAAFTSALWARYSAQCRAMRSLEAAALFALNSGLSRHWRVIVSLAVSLNAVSLVAAAWCALKSGLSCHCRVIHSLAASVALALNSGSAFCCVIRCDRA